MTNLKSLEQSDSTCPSCNEEKSSARPLCHDCYNSLSEPDRSLLKSPKPASRLLALDRAIAALSFARELSGASLALQPSLTETLTVWITSSLDTKLRPRECKDAQEYYLDVPADLDDTTLRLIANDIVTRERTPGQAIRSEWEAIADTPGAVARGSI